MGYYEGQRENPCPRCGGVVWTLFVSVAPTSYDQTCLGCGTTEFTAEEEAALGANTSRVATFTWQTSALAAPASPASGSEGGEAG